MKRRGLAKIALAKSNAMKSDERRIRATRESKGVRKIFPIARRSRALRIGGPHRIA